MTELNKRIFVHKKCKGVMKIRWGNGHGCFYDCSECSHFAVLPTEKQIVLRPYILDIDLKRNDLFIPKKTVHSEGPRGGSS